jgi:hypothetical protein
MVRAEMKCCCMVEELGVRMESNRRPLFIGRRREALVRQFAGSLATEAMAALFCCSEVRPRERRGWMGGVSWHGGSGMLGQDEQRAARDDKSERRGTTTARCSGTVYVL